MQVRKRCAGCRGSGLPDFRRCLIAAGATEHAGIVPGRGGAGAVGRGGVMVLGGEDSRRRWRHPWRAGQAKRRGATLPRSLGTGAVRRPGPGFKRAGSCSGASGRNGGRSRSLERGLGLGGLGLGPHLRHECFWRRQAFCPLSPQPQPRRAARPPARAATPRTCTQRTRSGPPGPIPPRRAEYTEDAGSL